MKHLNGTCVFKNGREFKARPSPVRTTPAALLMPVQCFMMPSTASQAPVRCGVSEVSSTDG